MNVVLVALLTAVTAAAPASGATAFERTEVREDCTDHQTLRQPFFGDLHVHTTLSFDAWAQGTRNTPRDAYRFAQGEAVAVQPYGAGGKPRRTFRLRRPLDFAMVSDHSEMLGETELCRTPGSSAYDRLTCVLLRRWPALGYMIVNSQWGVRDGRSPDMCGTDGAACRAAALGPWQEIRDAAEEFYDRTSACRFTTFVGFEWSGDRVGMIHRNVVFRNATVLDSPPNAIDDRHDERLLWTTLEKACLHAGNGCDALAIPHNSNLSEGSMFWTVDVEGGPLDAAMAARRAALEPLIEITQHKGDSECRAGGPDELCNFETLAFSNVAGHATALLARPVPPRVYVREGLIDGLIQAQRLGVNPFKLGVVGSTDTHLGTPGLVYEEGFPGHAAGVVTARLEIPPMPDHPVWNPGGLAVLWAEENSRDALFEAMRRREAYGTSGPRIILRVFGGWDFEDSMCGSADFVRRGYERGAPMGGDLPTIPAGAETPTFAILALKDAGTAAHPGTPLERIQIVKGWVENGERHERIFDVAGSDRRDTADVDRPHVDLATCEPQDGGAAELCTIWRDPDFEPSAAAFYYARAIEKPTCRWSWRACLAADVDCDSVLWPRGPLAACCDPDVPRTIQERAWSSPIWYTPPRLTGARRE